MALEQEQPTFASLDNMGVLGFTPRFEFNVTVMRNAPNVAVMTTRQFVQRGEYVSELWSYSVTHGSPQINIEQATSYVSDITYKPTTPGVNGALTMSYYLDSPRVVQCWMELLFDSERDLYPGDTVEFRVQPDSGGAVWWRPVCLPFPDDNADVAHWVPDVEGSFAVPIPTTAVMTLPAGEYQFVATKPMYRNTKFGGPITLDTQELPRAKMVHISHDVPLTTFHKDAIGHIEDSGQDPDVGYGWMYSFWIFTYVRAPSRGLFTVDEYRELSHDMMHVFVVKSAGSARMRMWEVYDVVEVEMDSGYAYRCAGAPCYRAARGE